MAIYKFSNAGGFANYTRYNDFLAGNPAVILDKGSMFPLGVFTLASAQTNIDFTNIPQTYTHLQIRFTARSTRNVGGSAATLVGVRVGNTTIDTGSNYAQHALGGDGATAFVGANSSVTSMPLGYISAFNATANIFGVGIIDILDYRNTSKNTTIRVLSGADLNGSGQIRLSSGLWMNTAAINAIQLFDFNGSGDFATNSSFALYGIL